MAPAIEGEVLGLTRANGPVLLPLQMLLSTRKQTFSNALVAFATNDVVTGNYVGFMREGMGVETVAANSWTHTGLTRIIFGGLSPTM
jgi:hypothetical protein